ncbi:MAG: hypothetical protein OEY67_05675, partial [Gammaproteobacteria bacterium]|nr:hypothetical protein [Gammaproteobacteria bacterium]
IVRDVQNWPQSRRRPLIPTQYYYYSKCKDDAKNPYKLRAMGITLNLSPLRENHHEYQLYRSLEEVPFSVSIRA